MLKLSNLKRAEGSKKDRKRVGRGKGSGYGKTSGRGENGQLKRAGAQKRPWFEGGQMPLYRRIPSKGFHNPFKKEYNVINVKSLNVLDDVTNIDPALLREKGIVKKKGPVKLLGDGKLSKKLFIKVHAVSESARAKIEELDGKVELIK